MKAKKFSKVGVIFSLLLFLSSNLFANSFILSDDNLIDPRAKAKILEIGNEAKTKLGVNIYVYAKKSLGLPENIDRKDIFHYIKKYEKEILPSVEEPYVLITMYVEDMYVNLHNSKELDSIIDKDDILDGYVVPLLASKDKNTLFAKVSASSLNGYAAIADTIAENKNIKLESSIGSEGKVSSTIWRVLMYTLVVSGLLAFVYAMLRKK